MVPLMERGLAGWKTRLLREKFFEQQMVPLMELCLAGGMTRLLEGGRCLSQMVSLVELSVAGWMTRRRQVLGATEGAADGAVLDGLDDCWLWAGSWSNGWCDWWSWA